MLLKWAAIFLFIALIAAAFGFGGVGQMWPRFSSIYYIHIIFLAIFVVVLVAGVVVSGKIKSLIDR